MSRTIRTKVSFAMRHGASTTNDMVLAGLFDMLRYDRSRVARWSHEQQPSGSVWILELEAERKPAIARWASFGIHAEVVV